MPQFNSPKNCDFSQNGRSGKIGLIFSELQPNLIDKEDWIAQVRSVVYATGREAHSIFNLFTIHEVMGMVHFLGSYLPDIHSVTRPLGDLLKYDTVWAWEPLTCAFVTDFGVLRRDKVNICECRCQFLRHRRHGQARSRRGEEWSWWRSTQECWPLPSNGTHK